MKQNAKNTAKVDDVFKPFEGSKRNTFDRNELNSNLIRMSLADLIQLLNL
ncbi:hypothetical protein [Cyclobacterium marinum]|uniref:Uncharacterized protein n=1 Tax=Cyclobacterium marinum (strain ATCC 25205 / DSM 745 / LMG 13164 / NCIMB 1802) TaxID=880070 RepID=G0J416_CYCMS|nr:hypothetical protein [Cyclobacterium marinum]AEL26682.1 hypothetical protein Cycma_2948 [Cyclobacterium marinum DSM 745]